MPEPWERILVVRYGFLLLIRGQWALNRRMGLFRDGELFPMPTPSIRLVLLEGRQLQCARSLVCVDWKSENQTSSDQFAYTGPDVLNQHDHRDPTSLSPSTRSRITDQLAEPSLSKRLVSRPLRVGVPIEYNITELAPPVREAWLASLRHLQKQGHTIHPVSLPATKLALSAYYVIAPAEASSNLAKYDGIRYGSRAEGPDSGTGPDGYLYARTRGEKFGPEVQRRILLGAFTLSANAMDNYFIQAQKVRRLVQADFDNAFSRPNPLASSASGSSTTESDPQHLPNNLGVDVLISPTAPSYPPDLSSLTDPNIPPVNAYISDVFTVPASLAGLPAISVPARSPESEQDTDMIGIQVIGQFGDDDLVMRVGDILEGARTV